MGEGARILYDFIWGEFCDWYIELVKPRLYGREDEVGRQTAQYVLWKVLENTLRLLHPFMPFITEEIWQHLPHKGSSICVAPWPQAGAIETVVEEEMDLLMAIIRGIRNIRAEMNIAPGKKAQVILQIPSSLQGQLEMGIPYIKQLAGADRVELEPRGSEKPRQAAAALVGEVEIYMPLEGLVDLGKEIVRLKKEKKVLQMELERSGKKMQNQSFLEKAPAEIIAGERKKEQEYQEKLAKVLERIALLEE